MPESILPDKRFRKTCLNIIESAKEKQTTVIRQLVGSRKERDRIYRFLKHSITMQRFLIKDVISSFDFSNLPEHVLVIGDTSEISTVKQKGRRKGEAGGVLSDNHTPGFMFHGNLAVDAQTGLPLGMCGLQSWQRNQQTQSKKERKGVKSNNKPLPDSDNGEEKEAESKKWERGVAASLSVLASAKELTFIHDREDDDYASLCAIERLGVNYIVRARNNRYLHASSGISGRLFTAVDAQPCLGSYSFTVLEDTRKKRKGREAKMELRYLLTRVKRPDNQAKDLPAYLDICVLAATETADSVPEGEKPIVWYLLTNREVKDLSDALRIIQWYRWRWLIEQLFRILKSAGLDIEDSGLDSIEEIQKLLILSIPAAVHTLQLTYGEQSEQMSIGNIYPASKVALLEQLSASLEGNSIKSKNPYILHSIAWARWIMARLGGWDPSDGRKAGVITLFNGVVRFEMMYSGWLLAKNTNFGGYVNDT